jgi:hypothetical protein
VTRIFVIAGGLVLAVFCLVETRSWLLSLIAVPVGMLGAALLARRASERAAGEAAFASWAAQRGWATTTALTAPLTTPLLREGDERHLEVAYSGDVAGHRAVVAHMTAITIHRTHHEDGTITETKSEAPFTVIELVTGLSVVKRFSLLPRHRAGELLEDVQSLFGTDRPVELESAELSARFRLLVADDDSEIDVRLLFTPSLIVEIVEQAREDVRIEFEQGALVLGVRGHRYDSQLFDTLTQLAGDITAQLLAVHDQAAVRGEAAV